MIPAIPCFFISLSEISIGVYNLPLWVTIQFTKLRIYCFKKDCMLSDALSF